MQRTYTMLQRMNLHYVIEFDIKGFFDNVNHSTERIIRYLREKYEVDINILFFNVVLCGTKRLISRAWFEKDVEEQRPDPKSIRQWNEEYYVSFGSDERSWVDAQKYGFISAGGGAGYSNTLKLLSPGDRVWVNIPHTGYVGVGIVRKEVQQAKDVRFSIDGQQLGFLIYRQRPIICIPTMIQPMRNMLCWWIGSKQFRSLRRLRRWAFLATRILFAGPDIPNGCIRWNA